MPRSRPASSHLRHGPDQGWYTETAPLPVVDALRAVRQALREGQVERAWIDLDNASHCLARLGGLDGSNPALGRAVTAVERARDLLGRAHASQAMAAISGALLALVG